MLESCLRGTRIGAFLHREKRYSGLGIPCLSLMGTMLCMGSVAMGTLQHAAVLWVISRVIVTCLYPKPSEKDQAWEEFIAELIETGQVTALPLGLWLCTESMTWAATCVLLGTLYVQTCSFHYLEAIRCKRNRMNSPVNSLPNALIQAEELTLAYTCLLLFPTYSVLSTQNCISLLLALLLAGNVVLDLRWSSHVLVS